MTRFRRSTGSASVRQSARAAAVAVAGASLALAPGSTQAQRALPLADYFGFEDARTLVLDEGCGPVVSADLNADGLPDLAVVNNAKSRVELFYHRAAPRTDQDIRRDLKANELPPSPWYDRHRLSVSHRLGALAAHDANGDGRADLIASAADPSELLIFLQSEGGTFELHEKRRVRELDATPVGLVLADVLASPGPEAVVTAGGRLHVFPITSRARFAEPTPLGAPGSLRAVLSEDFNGDGRADLLAVSPSDDLPLRLWLQDERGQLPTELRFELPSLTEVEPVRTPGRASASIGVIERASRRMVLYDLALEAIETGDADAPRDARAVVHAYPGSDGKDRTAVQADVNADGILDLVATARETNALAVHTRDATHGFGAGTLHPSFKQPDRLAAGDWDGDGVDEIFVLSEEEKAVGLSRVDPATGALSLPEPVVLATPAAEPESLAFVSLDGTPTLAVLLSQRRKVVMELHQPGAEPTVRDLDPLKKTPDAVHAADIDADGLTDLVLLTEGEPLAFVAGQDGEPSSEVRTSEDMPQFGLVEAAGPYNTFVTDLDADGATELVYADANFIRVCRFDSDRGWRVVEQINLPEPGTDLVSLSATHDGDVLRIVAADASQDRLLFAERRGPDGWRVTQRLNVLGFPSERVAMSGEDILLLDDDAFARVPVSGERAVLRQVAAHRPDDEDRYEHEIEVGDVNGDGFADLVVLDAGEQMCVLYTLSASRQLHHATEFKVFETRLFQRGDQREFEPSAALVADLTGDGRDDIALTVHDRIVIYPQQGE